jgi:hypothetical protein
MPLRRACVSGVLSFSHRSRLQVYYSAASVTFVSSHPVPSVSDSSGFAK